MEVPVPGGVQPVVVDHHDRDEGEEDHHHHPHLQQQQQPRAFGLETNSRSRSSNSIGINNNSKKKPSVDASTGSCSSSAAAANNYVHSFDDQGQAASYLQFFRRPMEGAPQARPNSHSSSINTAILNNSPPATATLSTAKQFAFDVYSTDRTTRTPLYPPPPTTTLAAGAGAAAAHAPNDNAAAGAAGASETANTSANNATATAPATIESRRRNSAQQHRQQQPINHSSRSSSDTTTTTTNGAASAAVSSPATCTASSSSGSSDGDDEEDSSSSSSSSSSSMFLMVSNGSGTALAQQQVFLYHTQHHRRHDLVPAVAPCCLPTKNNANTTTTTTKISRTSLESYASNTTASGSTTKSENSTSSSSPSTLATTETKQCAAAARSTQQPVVLQSSLLQKQPSLTSVASSSTTTTTTTAARSVTFHPTVATQVIDTANNNERRSASSSFASDSTVLQSSSLLEINNKKNSSKSDDTDADDTDDSNSDSNLSLLSQRGHLAALAGLQHVTTTVPVAGRSSPPSSVLSTSTRSQDVVDELVNNDHNNTGGDDVENQQQSKDDATHSPQASSSWWWRDAWSRVRAEYRDRYIAGGGVVGAAAASVGGAASRMVRRTGRSPYPLRGNHHHRRHHPMPLSPRSRNLADLHYLTAQHKQKLQQIFVDDDVHFDFVLVLQPQQVYGFWAQLLDFRVELLGQDVVNAMEEHWRSSSSLHTMASADNSLRPTLRAPSQTESDTEDDDDDDDDIESNAENDDVFVGTPTTGVRRRRNNSVEEDVATPLLATPVPNHNHNRGIYSSRRSLVSPGLYSCSATAANDTLLTTATKNTARKQSMFERAINTPHGDDDDDDDGDGEVLLERGGKGEIWAQQPKAATTSTTKATMAMSASKTATTTPATAYRRRWGNQQVQQQQQQQQRMNSQSTPPVRSLAARQRSSHKVAVVANNLSASSSVNRLAAVEISENSNGSSSSKNNNNGSNHDPNVLSMEDIPNQVIARGIAARTNRTNGMLPFLSALKRGIVLRRHRPNTEAVFCKLSSPDNGDTIVYQTVDAEEAILALREQRVRYNRDSSNVEAQPWSLEVPQQNGDHEFGNENNAPHNFSVPDYVAADAYRKRQAKLQLLGASSKLGHRVVSELANKVVAASRKSTGSAKVADAVAVHPARNKDPRAESSGALGSTTLRRSQSEYNRNLTFSLVVRAKKGGGGGGGGSASSKDKMEELENKWHEGEGSEAQFRYLDWEAATEGEYWLVFRGLLLLHRDAAVGRFAKQRAAGMGSTNVNIVDNNSSSELLGLVGDDNINAEHNRLHRDEFHEPVTVGWLEKMIVHWRDLDTTYMEGFVTKEGAVPPPSDYFLGFRSPGTAIWSRLRQAGLETRRVYSLDPNRVMIKIHCPYDRLMDVAEVLRIKLKTKDGSFAPFREDMIDVFDRLEDPLEGPLDDNPYHDFQFRSSIRQAIIDFIIGSRIRDSGAELDQTTDLGQMVQARVPLHMHGKLEAIYHAWFYFWKVENWDRGGHRLMHNDQLTVDYGAVQDNENDNNDGDGDDDPNMKYNPDLVPGCLTRFFVGCLNQPLDSIEQYFGEKVAFYFTWLQHTAFHLVFLSLAGLVVFICQLSSGNVDHPLRPFFAVVVMLWTFVVLVNWKKRANFMAYRWGTMNYKEQETTRPQFKGNYTQDEITREWIVTYPKWKRWLKYCISFPLTLFFTGGTLILILWVHANRDAQLDKYFREEPEDFHFNFTLAAIGQRKQIVDMELTKDKLLDLEFWIIMVGLPSMLGLCLPLLNFILMRLSVMLNDFENYRTESEYRTYLIIKVFSFRFICYFATLYYYAFASVGPEETAIENGILRVGTGVLVYTTVAQWWQNILHVCFPMLIRKIRMHHRQQRLTNELRNIELEEEDINRLSMNRIDDRLLERQARLINKRLLLEQAQDDTWLELMNPAHDSFPEYIQAVVQFTFVSCFSVVLPITPLIVLFNYLISMRLDAYKLCKGRRRPLAEKTGGIGVWEHVLHIVAVISVLTNCWLMGFTSSQFTWIGQKIGDLGLFALIVGWEHVMLLIKYVMSSSMSPLPKSVRDAMKREQHELDKQRNTLMQERRQQQFDDDDGMGSSLRFRKSCSPSSGGSSMRFRKSCSPAFRSKFDKAVAEEEENDQKEKRSLDEASEQV